MKFGLTEPAIDNFINPEKDHLYHPPYSLEDKFDYIINNMTEMMLADCEMTESEKKIIKKFAIEAGFEYSKKDNKVDFITSFENYEHFVYPMADIGKIYKLSHKILFSTQLLPNPIPKPEEWWYYGLEHGQHVSFYSKKTLKYIADKFSLQYYPINNGLHFFSDKRMSPILWFLITKFYPIIFPFIIMKKSSKTFQDMIYIKKKMEIE